MEKGDAEKNVFVLYEMNKHVKLNEMPNSLITYSNKMS